MPTIRRIEPIHRLPQRKRVAAYARVSVETERTHRSLMNQATYFAGLIKNNPAWTFAGIFTDEGITGTSTSRREGFMAMMEKAERGEIDLILTKSIQRFARNTVDLLNSIRRLKDLNVEVQFEKEHISTMDGSGELLLTLLASFAQEEARSISENIKWSLRKKNQKGLPSNEFAVYGYTWKDGILTPDPEEAPVVRRIFEDYLQGFPLAAIAKSLKQEGIHTRRGGTFKIPALTVILKNDLYTGDLVLQRYFTPNPIEKKEIKNRGELPQFLIESDHEPLVTKAGFQKVQDLLARRKAMGFKANQSLNLSFWSGKIKCVHCQKSYIRKQRQNGRAYWKCQSANTKGGRCPVHGSVPEAILEQAVRDIFGEDMARNLDLLAPLLDHVDVPAVGVLTFCMKDGTTQEFTWDRKEQKSLALKALWQANRTRYLQNHY